MSEGQLRSEAQARLDRKLERMGIVAPDEELSEAELRDMYRDELRGVYEEEMDREYYGTGGVW